VELIAPIFIQHTHVPEQGAETMTRRSFIGFFLAGGVVSLITKKLKPQQTDKKALFWRKK